MRLMYLMQTYANPYLCLINMDRVIKYIIIHNRFIVSVEYSRGRTYFVALSDMKLSS